MSLWLPGPEKNGRRSLYSIGAEPFQVMGTIAVVLAMLQPIVRWLRMLFQ